MPRIPEHFEQVDRAAKEGGKTAIISVGWDPGMFSLKIAYMLTRSYRRAALTAVLGKRRQSGTFRRDPADRGRCRRKTVYSAGRIRIGSSSRQGQNPELTTREKHTRECYVVAAEGADQARIERDQNDAELF